jgi:hypothetical protein
MNAFLEVMRKSLRGGFKTSEFWVTLLALLIPLLDNYLSPVIERLGPEGIVGGAVAAVYVFVRGWIKAKAAGEIAKQTPPESMAALVAGQLTGGQNIPTPQGWSGSSEGIPEYRPGWRPPVNPIPGVDTEHRPNDPKEI